MRLSRYSRPLPTLLLVTLTACSFSYSSKSLSDSVESSSGSVASVSGSLSSSSPGAAERAYKADVRDYTTAYVATGTSANAQTFQADLAHLAEKHGITDWESNMATYVAIGEGLGKAKVNEAQLLAYKRSLGRSDPAKMQAIQQGYESTR